VASRWSRSLASAPLGLTGKNGGFLNKKSCDLCSAPQKRLRLDDVYDK
jgi:hypothetical protein